MSSYQLEPHLRHRLRRRGPAQRDPRTISTGTAGWTGTSRAKAAGLPRPRPSPDAAIVGVDDAICRGIAQDLTGGRRAKIVVPVSAERQAAGGVHVAARPAHRRRRGQSDPRCSRWPALLACRASTTARTPPPPPMPAVRPRRHQPRGTRSPASNPSRVWPTARNSSRRSRGCDTSMIPKPPTPMAAAKALACYENCLLDRRAGWPKKAELPHLPATSRAFRHAFLIGQAAARFSPDTLGSAVPHSRCGELGGGSSGGRTRWRSASDDPAPSSCSPGRPAPRSTSFPNFEVRGGAFRRLVEALPGAGGRA